MLLISSVIVYLDNLIQNDWEKLRKETTIRYFTIYDYVHIVMSNKLLTQIWFVEIAINNCQG